MDAAFFHFSLFIIFFFSQMSELKAQKHGKTVQTTIRYETKTPIGRISMARDDARFSEIQNGVRVDSNECQIQLQKLVITQMGSNY